MSKVDKIANGILRIFNVLAWGLWLLGLIAVYGMNMPQSEYTYKDSFGFIITVPVKAFDWTGFIRGSLIWGVIVFIIYLIVIFVSAYILNGFRKTSNSMEKKDE